MKTRPKKKKKGKKKRRLKRERERRDILNNVLEFVFIVVGTEI